MTNEFLPILECWYLTGATASGKSELSRVLAKSLNAEIVSLDSMAIYRDMDIGTAKPSDADQSDVPHHLIDVVDPNQPFSLADYLSAAHAVVEAITRRGKQVLFVGGTPLYLKSLLRGVCGGPPADPDFRQQVEDEINRVGIEALRERLEKVDPLSASKLHPNDKRRMIRALEVHKLTGVPISHHQLQFEGKYTQRCQRVFALSRERAELHERIECRTEEMFKTGLIDETSTILSKYGSFSKTALQGVGYTESVEHLGGRLTLEQAIEQTKIRTRRFARRQETWLRGFGECQWLPITKGTTVEQLLSSILNMTS